MEVATDVVMYTDDLEGKLTEIVKEQSNDLEKFEYRDHEVLFQEPTELSYDLLMKKIDDEEASIEKWEVVTRRQASCLTIMLLLSITTYQIVNVKQESLDLIHHVNT